MTKEGVTRHRELAYSFPAVAVLVLLAGAAVAGESSPGKIALKQVPDVVKRAAAEVAPEVHLRRAIRASSEGLTAYLLAGRDKGGREVAIAVDGTGKVDRVEMTISLEDLPRYARDIALKSLKGRKYTKVKAVGPTIGHIEEYHFEGYGDRGELLGSILSIQAK